MIPTSSQIRSVVLAIVISEKGGAERREEFEQSELTIGRVQGNDLMLPKGNVSKKHARIVFRDGRYIVNDLNSTNGTYVNRRRIIQATIIRPGDRIYVGDFVLRIDAPDDQSVTMDRSSVPLPVRSPLATSPDRTIASPAPPTPSDYPIGAESSLPYPAVPPAPRVPARQPSDSGLSPLPSSAPMTPVGSSPREDSVPGDLATYRAALVALVERVEARVGVRVLDGEVGDALRERIERAIVEELATLRGSNVVPASVLEEPLKRDARAELCELGAVGALLEDDAVTEIAVIGTHRIAIVRAGHRTTAEPPVSSASALRRIVARLCRHAGSPMGQETMIERELPGGLRMTALVGEASPDGALLRLERQGVAESSLDDLVRSGVVSRAIATFLRQCVHARTNILLVGGRDAKTSALLSALAVANTHRPVVAVVDHDLLRGPSLKVTHVLTRRAGTHVGAAIELAARLPETRLMVEQLTGPAAAATLAAIAAGADGVVAALPAPTIRRGLTLLATELAHAHPGTSVDTFRTWIVAAFDLYVEVATLRDGRTRVLRVAEPTTIADGEIQMQDVFTFLVERTATGGSVEGTFHATGAQPRIVDDMLARGIQVDRTIFNRAPSR